MSGRRQGWRHAGVMQQDCNRRERAAIGIHRHACRRISIWWVLGFLCQGWTQGDSEAQDAQIKRSVPFALFGFDYTTKGGAGK